MQPPTEYVHLGWRPQLDALRCFAVSAVLVSHYVHLDDLPAGGLGVELFFAISGFLITSLLLEARPAAAPQGAAAVRFAWRNFVIRRALRIFPIYYVVITAAALCCDAVRAQWVWHATFSSNYLQFLEGGWGRQRRSLLVALRRGAVLPVLAGSGVTPASALLPPDRCRDDCLRLRVQSGLGVGGCLAGARFARAGFP